MSGKKETSVEEYEQYYKLLDLSFGTTDQEITSAYRVKALKLHPDKNRDDPKAREKFQELARAYQAVQDSEARKAYECVLALRKEREERKELLGAKRRALQDELLGREETARQTKEDPEAKLKERLAKIKEQQFMAEAEITIQRERAKASGFDMLDQILDRTLLITTSKAISLKQLEDLLKDYDPNVKVTEDEPGKSYTALFSEVLLSLTVMKMSEAKQYPAHLHFSWLKGKPPRPIETTNQLANRPEMMMKGLPKSTLTKEFECSVLEKMRLAQEKKQQASLEGSDFD